MPSGPWHTRAALPRQKVRPSRPFRGAKRAWRQAKSIDTSFMIIASCVLTFPARLAVVNGRFEVDNEHGEWHKSGPKSGMVQKRPILGNTGDLRAHPDQSRRLVSLAISNARNSGGAAMLKGVPLFSEELAHAWPKTSSNRDRSRRFTDPSTNCHSQSRPWYQVRRARILLGIADGAQTQILAFLTQCDESTVRRTCRRYKRLGLSGSSNLPSGRDARS